MSGLQVKQEAAVLVAIVDLNGEAGLLFNKRSTNLSSHRGQVWNLSFFFYNIFHFNKRSAKYLRSLIRVIFQVSFPGGKVDEGDLSIVDTALRETEEEIGLLKDQVSSFDWTISNHLNNTKAIVIKMHLHMHHLCRWKYGAGCRHFPPIKRETTKQRQL